MITEKSHGVGSTPIKKRKEQQIQATAPQKNNRELRCEV